MTDHAKELRQLARKIGRPAGDTPAVMHAAAAHIEKIERRLHGLEWDVTHWRANHAAEVLRARVLKERPDMPLERVEAYKQIGELLARVAELEAERAEREKQEPVAYLTASKQMLVFADKCVDMKHLMTPLYAATPVTAPVKLTDEEIVDALGASGSTSLLNKLARAIETAVLRSNGFDIQAQEGT